MVERKKLKYISLFSGIGAFEKGLKRLGIPYELIGFSEIDKYAVKSYCAIHNENESKNLGDITKIDEKSLPTNIDFVSYGFPCNDISIAGKKQGLFNDDGTQTRSGLFFDALRIIEETKPKVAIAENVKNLTSKSFNAQFQVILASLESAGYNNYYQVLNAKYFGVPQNRERVFIVSVRKDIDTGFFRFPEGFPLKLRLKDLLDDEVDEKYYLNDEITKKVLKNLRDAKSYTVESDNDDPKLHIACNLYESGIKGFNRDTGDVLYTSGICKTLQTMQGGNRQPKILVGEQNSNFIIGGTQAHSTVNTEGIAPCLTARMGTGGNNVPMHNYTKDARIRKLTPKECFRLMDFDDEDFEKAEAVNSNTQLYKQAGNSIVVAVLYYIFQALYDAKIFEEAVEEIMPNERMIHCV